MKTQTTFQNSSLVSVVNGSIVVKDAAEREHTFTNASIVSVNNGTIIIESEWKPKKGELVKVTGTCIDAYCILNNITGNQILTFGWKKINHDRHEFTNDFWLTNSDTVISPVTPEEQKEFDDFCKSQGKLWNKETLQWENYRWKLAIGTSYFYVFIAGGTMTVDRYTWCNDETDNNLYDAGNCFKTKEEAELKLKQIKKLLLEV